MQFDIMVLKIIQYLNNLIKHKKEQIESYEIIHFPN